MSSKLNPIPTLIAVAVAGLLAAGCASQTQSDNESVNNAGTAQSDTVSQTNPLDAPATTMDTPVATAPTYAEPAPLPPAETTPAPMPAMDSGTTTSSTPAMSEPAAPAPAAPAEEQPLPPRADRN